MKNENIRLIQGDCLKIMAELIKQGIKVDAIITDPPYGTTTCKWDNVIPFDEMWEQLNRIIKPNGAIVLFGSEPFSSALRMSNIKNYKYDWIWDKVSVVGFANAKKMPLYNIEKISVFYKKLPTYNPQDLIKIEAKEKLNGKTHKVKTEKGESAINGGRFKDSYTQEYTNYPKQILTFAREKGFHPTQKPLKVHELIHIFNSKIYYPQKTKGKMRSKMTGGMGTNSVDTIQNSTSFQEEYKNDDYYPKTIQEFSTAGMRAGRLHPTQKPVALMEYLIKTYTNENETVLDFTMGSGTTGVACKNLNRKFIGVELDENYFNIAKDRIESIV